MNGFRLPDLDREAGPRFHQMRATPRVPNDTGSPQAHALLHLYEAGRLSIELMRTMDEVLKQQQPRD